MKIHRPIDGQTVDQKQSISFQLGYIRNTKKACKITMTFFKLSFSVCRPLTFVLLILLIIFFLLLYHSVSNNKERLKTCIILTLLFGCPTPFSNRYCVNWLDPIIDKIVTKPPFLYQYYNLNNNFLLRYWWPCPRFIRRKELLSNNYIQVFFEI